MREWRVCEGVGKAEPDALEIYQRITARLRRKGQSFPRMTAIALWNDDLRDDYDTVATLDLCRGLRIVMNFRPAEPAAAGHTTRARGIEAIVAQVLNAVLQYRRYGLGKLFDELQNIRREARSTCAQHRKVGVNATVKDVRLQWWETRRRGFRRGVRAILSTMDAQLRPTEIDVDAYNMKGFPFALSEQLKDLAPRYAALREASAHGASGFITRLAVNSLAVYGQKPEEAVQAFRKDELDLANGLTLHPVDGTIRCWGRDPVDWGVLWSEDQLELEGITIPESVLPAMIGRPITEFIEHPVLSDDMIVTAAFNDSRHWHGPRLTVEFEAPRLLYCAETGRIWPVPNS